MTESESSADRVFDGRDEHSHGSLTCAVCGQRAVSPSLLACLHNCCAQHVVMPDTAAQSDATITCKFCQEVTERKTVTGNAYAANLAFFEMLRSQRSVCEAYAADGACGEPSECWCNDCNMAYCQSCAEACRKRPRPHSVVHFTETTDLTELAAKSVTPCVEHNAAFSYMCFCCGVPKCVECTQACLVSNHRLSTLTSEPVTSHVKRLREKVAEFRSSLGSQPDPTAINMHLREKMSEARTEAKRVLALNKLTLLSAVGKAHEDIGKQLADVYEEAEKQISDHMIASEHFLRAKAHVLSYSEPIARGCSDICLLQQQTRLLPRLKLLEKQQLMLNTRPSMNIASYQQVEISKTMLAEIQAWLGIPGPIDEIFNIKTYDAASKPQSNMADLSVDSIQLLTAVNPFKDACMTEVLRLDVTNVLFEVETVCTDVAVASDGRILLAAGERGMLEYSEDIKVSCWGPARTEPPHGSSLAGSQGWNHRREQVTTVEALLDGRAAVGLQILHSVVLLRRHESSPDKWIEDKHISTLQISPECCLAMSASLLASSGRRGQDLGEGGLNENELVLALWSEDKVAIRKSLDYAINRVAVTDQIVVTTSANKVRTSKGDERYVVDCYSHIGLLNWRRDYDEEVNDVCPSPSGKVLYIAMKDSSRLSAIMADNGATLLDVPSTSNRGPKRPLRLSVGTCGGSLKMAVLYGEDFSWKSVACYQERLQQQVEESLSISDAK